MILPIVPSFAEAFCIVWMSQIFVLVLWCIWKVFEYIAEDFKNS